MKIPTTTRYPEYSTPPARPYPTSSPYQGGYRQLLPRPGEWRTTVPESSLFWNAVRQLSASEQVEPEMPLAMLLMAGGMATQGGYDVMLPDKKRHPLSLNVKVVAEPNEGKTRMFKHVMSAFREVEATFQREYANQMLDYKAEIKIFRAKEKAILRNIEEATALRESTEDLIRHLKELHSEQPDLPRFFQILYQDTTPEAYQEGLSRNLPTGGIVTDEGRDTYKSALMRRLGLFNNLSDGNWTQVSRVSRETTMMTPPQGVRSSSLWLTQPAPLEEFLERHGEMGKATGTLARWIVCAPRRRQGGRIMIQGQVHDNSQWEKFKSLLKALIEANHALLSQPDRPRECLHLSEAAERDWVQLHNECDQQCNAGGRFEACPEHGGKIPEMIGRVAAILHLMEGHQGEIPSETVLLAADIVCAFSMHFQQIFLPPPQPVQDAELLDEWLNGFRSQNIQIVRHNFVRKCGPNRLRQKQRLEAALEVLIAQNRILPLYYGRTRYLNLTPYMQPYLPGGTH